MTFSRMAKSGGCVLAALALTGAAAHWAQAASLRDSLGASADDRLNVPMEGRFRSEAGAVFTLDRAPENGLLLRFDRDPEAWVLKPHLVSRGDVIYRNDVGQQVLRATRVGGLILFTPERPAGAAAAFMGDGPVLRLAPIATPAALAQALTLASARAGRAAQRTIEFRTRDAPPESWSLIADAMIVTAQAFTRHGADHGVRGLSGWRAVEVVVGRSPGVSAQTGGILRVVVDPRRGYAGRPSSQRIIEVLGKGVRP